MNATRKSNKRCTERTTSFAHRLVSIMSIAGWSDEDILAYVEHPDIDSDRRFEIDQIDVYGEVQVTAADMRAEVQLLMMQPEVEPTLVH